MKNYRDLVPPAAASADVDRPGKPSVASEMIQVLDPVLAETYLRRRHLNW